MAEKMRKHTFIIELSMADSERLETYLRETGMKKLGVMRKAILRYLDEKAPNTEN